jgi:hypothetical protein
MSINVSALLSNSANNHGNTGPKFTLLGTRNNMHTNNILVLEEFCFRQGISIENAAFKLVFAALKSVNQRMHVGGIFYDIAKSFLLNLVCNRYWGVRFRG